MLRLPDELARVNALLDDATFFAPFAPYFHPVLGRPSTPAEWYLRLMFLKFGYRLGYESLCAEVSDSISWRWFCRIGLGGTVPHPTTPMKLTSRCCWPRTVGKMIRVARRAQAAGGATGTMVRDRRRAAVRRVRQIVARLRSRAKVAGEESSTVIARVAGELAGLAEKIAGQACAVLRNRAAGAAEGDRRPGAGGTAGAR